jgi:hypothetical protein
MNKKALGGLVVLSGITLIGFVWFKKNKPNLGSDQLKNLTAQSNNISTGADEIDKPFQYSQQALQNQDTNTYNHSLFQPNYTNLTPKEIKDLGIAVNQSCPSCANLGTGVSNQITQNMQNADFSQLGNLGLANIDWSNIKIK